MAMRVHEVHAASTHAPLVVLPAAALVDLAAAVSGDRGQAALGRKLWWLGVGAGALAGVAGLAASQEIKADDPRTEDMMWLHGAANFMILLGATGIALWRSVRRPSVTSSAIGLGACALATYTAGGRFARSRGASPSAAARSGSSESIGRIPGIKSCWRPGRSARFAGSAVPAAATFLLGAARSDAVSPRLLAVPDR